MISMLKTSNKEPNGRAAACMSAPGCAGVGVYTQKGSPIKHSVSLVSRAISSETGGPSRLMQSDTGDPVGPDTGLKKILEDLDYDFFHPSQGNQKRKRC